MRRTDCSSVSRSAPVSKIAASKPLLRQACASSSDHVGVSMAEYFWANS